MERCRFLAKTCELQYQGLPDCLVPIDSDAGKRPCFTCSFRGRNVVCSAVMPRILCMDYMHKPLRHPTLGGVRGLPDRSRKLQARWCETNGIDSLSCGVTATLLTCPCERPPLRNIHMFNPIGVHTRELASIHIFMYRAPYYDGANIVVRIYKSKREVHMYEYRHSQDGRRLSMVEFVTERWLPSSYDARVNAPKSLWCNSSRTT